MQVIMDLNNQCFCADPMKRWIGFFFVSLFFPSFGSCLLSLKPLCWYKTLFVTFIITEEKQQHTNNGKKTLPGVVKLHSCLVLSLEDKTRSVSKWFIFIPQTSALPEDLFLLKQWFILRQYFFSLDSDWTSGEVLRTIFFFSVYKVTASKPGETSLLGRFFYYFGFLLFTF